MNELDVIESETFIVTKRGEAFISQAKVAELCGVTKQAIQKFISKDRENGCRLILNKNNQLSAESLALVVEWYALDSPKITVQARSTYRILVKLGARVWVYQQAGYSFTACMGANQLYEEENKALTSEKLALQLESDSMRAKVQALEIRYAMAQDLIEELEDQIPDVKPQVISNCGFFGKFNPFK